MPNPRYHSDTPNYDNLGLDVKLQELSENIESYRELKDKSDQISGVVKAASDEVQRWKKMADTQRKKHSELNKRCRQTTKKLKKEATRKDELGKLLGKTEKRAAENERFKLHAEDAIQSASMCFTFCFLG